MTLVLPPEKVAALESLRDNGHPLEKFSHNPQGWVDEAEEIAIGLGLHQGPPLRILDIGCGYGYFLWVCQQYGHDGLGIDLPAYLPFEANTILGQLWLAADIQPSRLWPRAGKYNLITTFGVNFRMQDRRVYWRKADYRWLATTIRMGLQT